MSNAALENLTRIDTQVLLPEKTVAALHLDNLKKGALHKDLGVPENEKIPADKLDKALHSKNPKLRKRAQFAKNAKKWNKGKKETAKALANVYIQGEEDKGNPIGSILMLHGKFVFQPSWDAPPNIPSRFATPTAEEMKIALAEKGLHSETASEIENISMDIPLFVRILEWAQSESKNDVDLHYIVERILKLNKHPLIMDDYPAIVGKDHSEPVKPTIEPAGAIGCEKIIEIHANGDFNWKDFLTHLHELGSRGSSRPVIIDDEDGKPDRYDFDGDGADKIMLAKINDEMSPRITHLAVVGQGYDKKGKPDYSLTNHPAGKAWLAKKQQAIKNGTIFAQNTEPEEPATKSTIKTSKVVKKPTKSKTKVATKPKSKVPHLKSLAPLKKMIKNKKKSTASSELEKDLRSTKHLNKYQLKKKTKEIDRKYHLGWTSDDIEMIVKREDRLGWNEQDLERIVKEQSYFEVAASDIRNHLENKGWEQGKDKVWRHPVSKNQIYRTEPATHKYHYTVTHKNGEVTRHKTNSDQMLRNHISKLSEKPDNSFIGKTLNSNKGSLHEHLGVPHGQKIPLGKLEKLAKSDHPLAGRARLVLNLQKAKKRGPVEYKAETSITK